MKHVRNMTVITVPWRCWWRRRSPSLRHRPPPRRPPPASASARPRSPVASRPRPVSQAAPSVKVERGAGGKKVYRITEAIRIEGKIQKPEAFYVLQKSSIDYDWEELRQEFVPKILDSVSQSTFLIAARSRELHGHTVAKPQRHARSGRDARSPRSCASASCRAGASSRSGWSGSGTTSPSGSPRRTCSWCRRTPCPGSGCCSA